MSIEKITNKKVWNESSFHHHQLSVNGEKVASIKQWDNKDGDGLEFTFDASYGNTRYSNHKLEATSLEEAKREVEKLLLNNYSEYVSELKKEIERYNKLVKILYTKDETNESVGDNNG